MNERFRYPWLAVYGAVSMIIAVIVASLSLVAAAGVYVALVDDRGGTLASAAAVGILVGGLFTAVTIGVAADVVRWMQDVVALQREQRDLLRRD